MRLRLRASYEERSVVDYLHIRPRDLAKLTNCLASIQVYTNVRMTLRKELESIEIVHEVGMKDGVSILIDEIRRLELITNLGGIVVDRLKGWSQTIWRVDNRGLEQLGNCNSGFKLKSSNRGRGLGKGLARKLGLLESSIAFTKLLAKLVDAVALNRS